MNTIFTLTTKNKNRVTLNLPVEMSIKDINILIKYLEYFKKARKVSKK